MKSAFMIKKIRIKVGIRKGLLIRLSKTPNSFLIQTSIKMFKAHLERGNYRSIVTLRGRRRARWHKMREPRAGNKEQTATGNKLAAVNSRRTSTNHY